MGLVQGAWSGPPFDGQQSLNYLLQGASLGCRKEVCRVKGEGQRWEQGKGSHFPHGQRSQGLPTRLCPPACLAPPSFSPSLARSTARFTRFSRASQSSWPERPVGSRCMRPCSTDSSWADAGEQLTCINQNRQVDGHPRPWAGCYPPAHAPGASCSKAPSPHYSPGEGWLGCRALCGTGGMRITLYAIRC